MAFTGSDLFIVDTKMSQDEAAAHALVIYKQLVANGVIESAFIESGFKVRDDYQLIDQLNSVTVGRRDVRHISLDVLGHYWGVADGVVQLLPLDGLSAADVGFQFVDGFFYNREGGFFACCPHCDESLSVNDDERSEDFIAALTVWMNEAENQMLHCDLCGTDALLSVWHSSEFAIGAVAITLMGVEFLDMDEQQEKQLLKDLGFSNEPRRVAWVSCHS